jgi:transcriptional regulator with XRE-family HTH domain
MSDGENIRNIRKRKGLTQEELGALLGVGKSAVSRWESGEREVTLATMRNIAAALDVPLERLVEGLESSPDLSGRRQYHKGREKGDIIYGVGQPNIGTDVDERIDDGTDEVDPDHIGAVSEKHEDFNDRSQMYLTLPRIDDPELISAFEGFKELDKLTPSDIDDIKAILRLAQRIIDKRKKVE